VIDFHCHLDLYPDALKLLDEVARRNEFTLAVTTSPRAFLGTSRIFAGKPNIYVSLGLHPEVAEAKQNEEGLLVQLVASARFIGEIGLDGSTRFKPSLPLQERIFTSVVAECQRQGGRVMSIHSRGAESRLLDILEAHPNAGTPVLHWFSGNRRELQRAVELGCWFSVGPAMLAGEKGRAHLSQMPLDRVLPETDGPFAQRRGTPLMPWDVSDVVGHLEHLMGTSKMEVSEMLRANLNHLLGLRPLARTPT
jgi:TatD DNase family protein